MKEKLKSERGESLVEILASVLIASLSVGLLVTMIMTSARMNDNAENSDREYYQSLSLAEAQLDPMVKDGAPVTTKVTIQRMSEGGQVGIPVEIDGAVCFGGDGIYSYKITPKPGPPSGP